MTLGILTLLCGITFLVLQGRWKLPLNLRAYLQSNKTAAVVTVFMCVSLLVSANMTEAFTQHFWRVGLAAFWPPVAQIIGFIVVSAVLVRKLRQQGALTLPHYFAVNGHPKIARLIALAAILTELLVLSLYLAHLLSFASSSFSTQGDIFAGLLLLLSLVVIGLRGRPGTETIVFAGFLMFLVVVLLLYGPSVYLAHYVPIDWPAIHVRLPGSWAQFNLASGMMLPVLASPALYYVLAGVRKRTSVLDVTVGTTIFLVFLVGFFGFVAINAFTWVDLQVALETGSFIHYLVNESLSPGLAAASIWGFSMAFIVAIQVLVLSIQAHVLHDVAQGYKLIDPIWRMALAAIILLFAAMIGSALDLSRFFFWITSAYVGILTAPLVLFVLRPQSLVTFVVMVVISATIYLSAIAQKSPGDPAVWSAGVTLLYGMILMLVQTIKARKKTAPKEKL